MKVPRALFARGAAIAAAGSTLVILVGLAVLAYVQISASERDERNRLEQEISLYRVQASQHSLAESTFKQLQGQIRAAPALMHTPDDARAGAELQDVVRQLAASFGGEVRTAEILPVSRTRAFDVVSVRYELTIPAGSLRDLVYAVETHKPYIFVARTDIVAPMKIDKRSIFDVQWVLRAYRWHSS